MFVINVVNGEKNDRKPLRGCKSLYISSNGSINPLISKGVINTGKNNITITLASRCSALRYKTYRIYDRLVRYSWSHLII